VAARRGENADSAGRQPGLTAGFVTISCRERSGLAAPVRSPNLPVEMTSLRRNVWGRIGASLAGMALTLQLAFASWGVLLTASAATADPFAGHALCLAGSGGAAPPAVPADRQPAAPIHDHAALCCLWHPLPALHASPVLTPEPVAFAAIVQQDHGQTPFLPGTRHGPANARAPPTLA
jgi:hypothetical protein